VSQPDPTSSTTRNDERRTTMGKANDHGVVKNDPTVDCDRPACDDMMSKLKKAAQAAATAPPSPTATKSSAADSGGPLGSADLGRSTWGLLHSMVREWYLCTKSLAAARTQKATRKLMLFCCCDCHRRLGIPTNRLWTIKSPWFVSSPHWRGSIPARGTYIRIHVWS
jgi:hypothetical protein